jgi:hypothetical protein
MKALCRVLACLAVLAAPAAAYTVAPMAGVHEAMTRAAKLCLDEALSRRQKPARCRPEPVGEDVAVDLEWVRNPELPPWDIAGWLRHWTGKAPRYPDLAEASRWPDDPTRQLGLVNAIRFTWHMVSACDLLLGAGERNDIDDGLLCNSHVGDMQFMHAQAGAVGEPAAETREKIGQWAEFLFLVASGRLSRRELDTPYCRYFAGSSAFHRAMRPHARVLPCGGRGRRPWTVATLFNFVCQDPFTGSGCKDLAGPRRFAMARLNATGALLHLVQDAYAQSHVERGQCERHDGEVVAKVECAPIVRFTTYRGQQGHAAGDAWPRIAASCRATAAVDDPVTASAKVLWHIRRKSPPAEFRRDLARVFGTPEAAARLPVASHGQCLMPEEGG